MSLSSLYAILTGVSIWGVGIELYGKTCEGLTIIKQKSANGNSRHSKLATMLVMSVQCTTLFVGMYVGGNNWVPLAMFLPVAVIYVWLIYLCFKYKDKPFEVLKLN